VRHDPILAGLLVGARPRLPGGAEDDRRARSRRDRPCAAAAVYKC